MDCCYGGDAAMVGVMSSQVAASEQVGWRISVCWIGHADLMCLI